MTEDEAKTRTCCGPPAAANAIYWRGEVAVEAPMLCIASACMAWRWKRQPVTAAAEKTEAVQIGSRMHVERVPAVAAVVGDGFCGLAGAPQ